MGKLNNHSPYVDLGTKTTWIERLTLNLLSYSIVLIPIAFIVILTKQKLWPQWIQNSHLIRIFVYGNNSFNTQVTEDSEKLIIDESQVKAKNQISVNPISENYLKFLYCALGLELSYLIWGILQEKIMTTSYSITQDHVVRQTEIINDIEIQEVEFHDSQFLVLLNRITAFIVSIIALLYNRPKLRFKDISFLRRPKPSAPAYEYVYSSLSNILSSWCQYEALKYVNFPTQVLSKSCKVIPVMIMSKIILRKKHRSSDYLSAFALSLGMFIFLVFQPPRIKHDQSSFTNETPTIFDKQLNLTSQQPRQEGLSKNQYLKHSDLASGLTILGLYLAFDSFTSNWQQSLFARYDISEWQMMAASNFYSILLTLTSLYQLKNLAPAIRLLQLSPSLLFDCVSMSIMSSIGQLFVYYTIKNFGSVVFAVIMTLRQFLAILLSCLIYSHPLTKGSIVGLIIVFLIIAIETSRKIRVTRSRHSNAQTSRRNDQSII